MRALEPEVVDVIWAAVEPMLPARPVRDPGRGHRPRIPDRLCFWGILVRLATGCSWRLRRRCWDGRCRTPLRSRRDEWVAAGVFEMIAAEAIAAYDRIVGLDLDDVCIAGPPTKLPAAAKEPAKAPWTGENSAGSGRSRQTRGSRSRGPPPARTATTSCCSTPPSPRSNDKASITTPRPCTSTAATGAPASTTQQPRPASTIWCGPPNANPATTAEPHSAAGAALASRAHQLMAVQLRATATKLRPKTRAPPRPARPRRRLDHHPQTPTTATAGNPTAAQPLTL